MLDDIEEIRRKNNVNWMQILRIALEADPKRTREVLKRINESDKKISNLMEKL